MSAASGVVVAPIAFNTDPDVSLGFEPDSLILKATAGVLDVSFDGIHTHLTLEVSDKTLIIPTKRRKMWVRLNDPTASLDDGTSLRWSALTLA
jgi:hypothetical protein